MSHLKQARINQKLLFKSMTESTKVERHKIIVQILYSLETNNLITRIYAHKTSYIFKSQI